VATGAFLVAVIGLPVGAQQHRRQMPAGDRLSVQDSAQTCSTGDGQRS
jgi:hypothetical protein